MQEYVKQDCIVKTGVANFFNYIDEFFKKCFDDFSPNCLDLKSIDPNEKTIVQDCQESSWLSKVNKRSNENQHLEHALVKIQRSQPLFWPSLYINDRSYQVSSPL